MQLGYNTNGLSHHDIFDALELLHEIGYQSIAITLDHATLNPYGTVVSQQFDFVKKMLEQFGMRSTIETNARFLLDPRVKHTPTLLSSTVNRRRARVEFLRHAIDVAEMLGSDCVSLGSGYVEDSSEEEAYDLLLTGLKEVTEYADLRDVQLGFEPIPGMLIDTTARYEQLLERFDSPRLQLTLDIGNVHGQQEGPLASVLERVASRLINVRLADAKEGTDEHFMFGEGELDFAEVTAALKAIQYTGPVHVELDRHSHDGAAAATSAYQFLHPLFADQ
jgi:L-ribulose-5-phosphate 3-epimerase